MASARPKDYFQVDKSKSRLKLCTVTSLMPVMEQDTPRGKTLIPLGRHKSRWLFHSPVVIGKVFE